MPGKRLLCLLAILALLSLQTRAARPNFTAGRGQLPFHRLDCKWVDNILAENAEYFETIQQALAAGHRPCKECNPDDGIQTAPDRSLRPVPVPYYPFGPPGVTQKRYQLVTFQTWDAWYGIACENAEGQTRRFQMSDRLLARCSVDKWQRGCEVGLLTYEGIGGETVHTAFPYQLSEENPINPGFGIELP